MLSIESTRQKLSISPSIQRYSIIFFAVWSPIDRTYSFNFFYNRNMLSISEQDAFREMFSRFHCIGLANRAEIAGALGRRWHTSETKVIDNAIVGYVVEVLRPSDLENLKA